MTSGLRVALQVGAVALSGLLAAGSAYAAAGSEFNAFMDLATGAGKHTVGFNNGGTPLVSRGVPGPTSVGNMNFALGPNGVPEMRGKADLPSPLTGQKLPLDVKAPVDKFRAARAIGNFAAKVAGPLVLASATYSLIQEMGWLAEPDPDGTGMRVFQPSSEQICYMGTCFAWSLEGVHPTPEAGLAARVAATNSAPGSFNATAKGCDAPVFTSPTEGTAVCYMDLHVRSSGALFASNTTVVANSVVVPPTQSTTFKDATIEELVNKIASESGWPTETDYIPALVEAVKSGESVGAGDQASTTVTGPNGATSGQLETGPKTTTKTDGSTETKNEVCDWVISMGGVLNYQCGSTTTTTTPEKTTTEAVTETQPDGTTKTVIITKTIPGTTETTTTTEAPGTKEEQQNCGAPGQPPCKIDETSTPATVTLTISEAEITAQADENKTTISGTADKGQLDSWGSLFVTPPVAACQAVEFAMFGGSVITADPCPVVDGVRTFMAYMWALAGFWCCIGFVREAI